MFFPQCYPQCIEYCIQIGGFLDELPSPALRFQYKLPLHNKLILPLKTLNFKGGIWVE